MTVLVTGAAGFLGSHVTEALLARGERTRALVRPGEALGWLATADVETCQGDITDRPALEVAMKGVDRVLHCAARTGPWGPATDYEMTNVRGLATVVETALSSGVQRIVHVSSVTVHGVDVRGTADEAAPLRGGSDPYSRSKVAGEHLLQQIIRDKGAPVTIVRPGLVYGPRDLGNLGKFAELIEQGKMVMIGSGANHLPLIHVKDTAQGILQASIADRAIGRAYILVNDEVVTQRDYLNSIASELGRTLSAPRIPYRVAAGMGLAAELAYRALRLKQPPPLTRFGVEVLGGENLFTINRAREELGFSPQINLAEGVRDSIAWYRGKAMSQARNG